MLRICPSDGCDVVFAGEKTLVIDSSSNSANNNRVSTSSNTNNST